MSRLVFFVLALTLPMGCEQSRETEARVAPPADAERLRDYVAIDTSNPPGNEGRGARFLHRQLKEQGIDAELIGPDGRESVYARLDSGIDAPGLLIHHHIDTVSAGSSEAKPRTGYISGPGLLDTKSLGIAQLRAFEQLLRSERPLTRDVVFLGVADEEAGGGEGMRWLLENRPELFEGIGWALGEGGGNVAVVDRQQWWGIEIAQKTPLWIRVRVEGPGGHGSAGESGGAIETMLELLPTLVAPPQDRVPVVTPEMAAYFRSLARAKRPALARILRDAADRPGPDTVASLPPPQATLTEVSAVLTGLRSSAESPNVVPAAIEATIDYRLPPGVSSDVLLPWITQVIGGRATFEILLEEPEPAPPAAPEGEFWEMLRGALGRVSDAPSGPLVAPGFNDNRHLRRHGIVAYGFSPFKINYYDAATIHTPVERIREEFFAEGVEVMSAVVAELATGAQH